VRARCSMRPRPASSSVGAPSLRADPSSSGPRHDDGKHYSAKARRSRSRVSRAHVKIHRQVKVPRWATRRYENARALHQERRQHDEKVAAAQAMAQRVGPIT
jgi:hypothetical protein